MAPESGSRAEELIETILALISLISEEIHFTKLYEALAFKHEKEKLFPLLHKIKLSMKVSSFPFVKSKLCFCSFIFVFYF